MNPNDWLLHATRLQAVQQAFALVTVLRVQTPASARPGDKALVTQDGIVHGWIGGGCAQPAVIKTVRTCLADGQPRAIRIAPADNSAERQLDDVLEFGMACHSGGTIELFIDPVLPSTALTIFGDSPVARSLATLAPSVGLRVHVVAQGAMPDSFSPAVTKVIDTDEPEAVRASLPEGGFAVVASQGRRDIQALRAALALRPRHLWFVASARKAAVLKESLVASGEALDRVAAIMAPAGEDIGAKTPEEIALSVLTTVIATRRGRMAPVADSGTTAEASAVQPAAKSCCGGSKKEETESVARTATDPVGEIPPAKSSCCGG